MHCFHAPGRRAFALGFLFLAAGCATTGINRGDINLVSIEEEWQLGDQTAAEVARQVRLSNDGTLNAYVNRMGQRIVAQTEMANLPWQFHVVEDDAINAFNIPGGHVYVNTGLIANAGSAAELASVVAHEVMHGVSRHGTERLSVQYGASAIAGALLGSDPGLVAQIATQAVAGAGFAKYSRDAEREADRYGIRYMTAAGYNPNGMVSMFRTLLNESGGGSQGIPFFSSHPLTEERIENAQQQIDGMNLPSGLITNDGEFNNIRARAR